MSCDCQTWQALMVTSYTFLCVHVPQFSFWNGHVDLKGQVVIGDDLSVKWNLDSPKQDYTDTHTHITHTHTYERTCTHTLPALWWGGKKEQAQVVGKPHLFISCLRSAHKTPELTTVPTTAIVRWCLLLMPVFLVYRCLSLQPLPWTCQTDGVSYLLLNILVGQLQQILRDIFKVANSTVPLHTFASWLDRRSVDSSKLENRKFSLPKLDSLAYLLCIRVKESVCPHSFVALVLFCSTIYIFNEKEIRIFLIKKKT